MVKMAIIGLGLVGNSIGMALKRAYAGDPQEQRVVGFDPDRSREEASLRRHGSVDEIAPDLERAVRGAQLVVIATPGSALREVMSAIGPFLDEGATVTDTNPTKEWVMELAGEILGTRAGFIGGHPFSKSVDLEMETGDDSPSADLFVDAPYAIMPLRGARNEDLNRVIALAEAIGAKPLFIDPVEHDSFLAATNHLPFLASAALLRVTTTSPAWSDMRGLTNRQFRSVTDPLAANPQLLSNALLANSRVLVSWLDQYMLALREMRDLLASDSREALAEALSEAHDSYEAWAHGETDSEMDTRLRAELREAINESRPARALMGNYLADRFFRKKTGREQ